MKRQLIVTLDLGDTIPMEGNAATLLDAEYVGNGATIVKVELVPLAEEPVTRESLGHEPDEWEVDALIAQQARDEG